MRGLEREPVSAGIDLGSGCSSWLLVWLKLFVRRDGTPVVTDQWSSILLLRLSGRGSLPKTISKRSQGFLGCSNSFAEIVSGVMIHRMTLEMTRGLTSDVDLTVSTKDGIVVLEVSEIRWTVASGIVAVDRRPDSLEMVCSSDL